MSLLVFIFILKIKIFPKIALNQTYYHFLVVLHVYSSYSSNYSYV